MRDFFKSELKTLHLKTGFQQYFKLSEMPDSAEQIKTLLDLLVKECDKFPMIPDQDKKKIIQTCMIEDADFQGFNPKILWKWFNAACRRFIATQADYQESENHRPAYEVFAASCKEMGIDPGPAEDYGKPMTPERMKVWTDRMAANLAQIGNPQVARPDGIKDHRIQKMRDGFRGIECKHPTLIDVSETEDVCNDCGKSFPKAAPSPSTEEN